METGCLQRWPLESCISSPLEKPRLCQPACRILPFSWIVLTPGEDSCSAMCLTPYHSLREGQHIYRFGVCMLLPNLNVLLLFIPSCQSVATQVFTWDGLFSQSLLNIQQMNNWTQYCSMHLKTRWGNDESVSHAPSHLTTGEPSCRSNEKSHDSTSVCGSSTMSCQSITLTINRQGATDDGLIVCSLTYNSLLCYSEIDGRYYFGVKQIHLHSAESF